MKKQSVSILSGGGGPAEPVPYLVPSDWTTRNLREKAEPTAERHPQSDSNENLTNEVLVPSDWSTKNPYCHSELVSESVPRYERVSNIGQTLNPSCSTREKRHREKRGFRLVPLLARAVPGDNLSSLRAAFTMAEILLSLTIIGVVAAITLPSLTGNINERTWNTQRKALYARFSQAISLMPALNGYGTLTEGDSSTSAVDTAAETFITAGLSKVLKMTNICDSEHLSDCGLPDKITPHTGSVITPFPADFGALNSTMLNASYTSFSYSMLNTKAAAFETQNGESVAVYYNPNCVSELSPSVWWDPIQNRVCANFIYDLNGKKGPNTYGKDIGFITVLYSVDSVVVAPLVHSRNATAAPLVASGSSSLTASKSCTQLDANYRLPTKEEAGAMFVNQNLIGSINEEHYWTSSLSLSNNESRGWAQSLWTGARLMLDRTQTKQVRCVKRD